MSAVRKTSQKSKEFKTFTITRRGRDLDVRVPQLSPDVHGAALKHALGRMAFELASENRDKACGIVSQWLTADFQLLQRTVDKDLIARECVDDYLTSLRRPIKLAATNQSAARRDGAMRASVTILMRYHLRRGVKMENATRIHLREEITDHRKKGLNMLQHAAWCEHISNALPDDKTKVGTVLKESDLKRFLEKAQKEVA